MIPVLVSLIPIILGFVALYFVVKAAVAKGIQDALQRMQLPLEVSARSAVREGVLEALLMLQQNTEAEEENHE